MFWPMWLTSLSIMIITFLNLTNSTLHIGVYDHGGENLTYLENLRVYEFDINDILYFNCKDEHYNYLTWKDSYGHSVSEAYTRLSTIIRIITDADEGSLKLTCLNNQYESITVQITARNSSIEENYKRNKIATPQILYPLKGASITLPNNCQGFPGLVRYPNGSKLHEIKPDGIIVDRFTEKQNGTLLLCVSFEKSTHFGCDIWQRRIVYKEIYILNQTLITNGKINSTGKTVVGFNRDTIKIVIVTVTVGVILIVTFIIVIITVRYKKKNKSNANTAQVTYADVVISEGISSPPRIEDIPYANIVGVMTNGQTNDEDNLLYSNVYK